MTGCERCNTVNTAKRHVYIVLFKGDDSDFAWNQNIEITLETEMDLTGFRAKFSFMDFTQEFADITSKKLVLVFPATATASFPLGAADASIVLYDSDGKARTIANRIHMIVTKCVDEAYANEDPQAITVSISSSMEREQSDWDETDTQSPSYIRNKPEIPSIDTTLTQSGAAADAKAVGYALRGGFTEWEFSGSGYDPSTTYSVYIDEYEGGVLIASLVGSDGSNETAAVDSLDVTSITFEFSEITATRHLITPTKTSQLTNDGAPNGGGNAYVMTNDSRLSDARTPTAHHATHAANGSDPLAPADIGAAAATDLPYALVTPGEWEFSGIGVESGVTYTIGEYEVDGTWYYDLNGNGEPYLVTITSSQRLLTVDFWNDGDGYQITATRASLPGHLCDRAGNRVVVSGDTTLTLPSALGGGRLRDFLVRLEISGSTVPTITFAAPTGETLTYETDGDEFPVPDEAGTWLYSFTETAASTFAVALKAVSTVAAPTQGGS